MERKISFNLNEFVYVKLTAKGQAVLEQAEPGKIRHCEDGYTRFQFWYFMQIFGEHTGLAMPQLFDSQVFLEHC